MTRDEMVAIMILRGNQLLEDKMYQGDYAWYVLRPSGKQMTLDYNGKVIYGLFTTHKVLGKWINVSYGAIKAFYTALEQERIDDT